MITGLHLRLLLLFVFLLAVHSIWLWWSLTPVAGSGRESAEPRSHALQLASTLPKQPSGNLFVAGRERRHDNDEPVTEPEVSAAPFTLYAVLAVGEKYYALFSNDKEQLKLTTGDMLPGRGRIDHIERHAVIIASGQSESERLQLFPIPPNTSEGDGKGNIKL